jgi:hypothetical protein
MRQVPPKAIAVDNNSIEAKLAGANACHIAARPAADDENFGLDVFGHDQRIKIVAGCSSIALIVWIKLAASKPSMMR